MCRMTTAPEPRWRRLEPDQRREQIFTCAARLFGERPYAAVSTSDIAAEAGVARGLINHYFGTKRELYLAVIRRAVTMPALDTEDRLTGSLYERAHSAVEWFLDMVLSQGKMWLVATSEGIGLDHEVEQIIVDAERKSAERLLDGFCVPADSAVRGQLNALVRSFAGMVKAAGREWLLREELDRGQVHILLYQTLITLLEDVFPKVLNEATSD
jgi:AcrR family transcriptional regulator